MLNMMLVGRKEAKQNIIFITFTILNKTLRVCERFFKFSDVLRRQLIFM